MKRSTEKPTSTQNTSAKSTDIFDYPIFFIRTIQNENYSNIVRILKPFNLGLIEFRVLAQLHHRDGLSVSELARLCLVKHSAISVLTQAMVRGGLVRRSRDQKDQRVTRIHLTADGHKKVSEILPSIFTHQEFLTSDLSRRQYDELMRMLKKIYARVTEAQGRHPPP